MPQSSAVEELSQIVSSMAFSNYSSYEEIQTFTYNRISNNRV